MNDNSRNNGALIFAGVTILAATVAVALAHRPTRKRIRGGLIEAIDRTDRKLDDMDAQTRKFASNVDQKIKQSQKDTIKQLQTQLTSVQKQLEKMQ